jgi:ATP-binding cassette subfamily B protein
VSYKEVRSVWLGFLSKLIENFTSKCLLSILLAKLIKALVEGDRGFATKLILITTGVLIATAIVNAIGDHFFVKYTDKRYKVLAGDFHSKLLAKDVAYFEQESVGKLESLFRNHLDGTIKVIRLLRGNVLSFLSALFFPVIALVFYDLKIAVAVLIIGLIELWVTNWTANKVKLQRKDARAVYDTLTGEVTDQLLNITVVKASGREDSFKQSVVDLAEKEEKLFTHRHKFEAASELFKATLVAIGLGLTLLLITKENTSTKETTELIVISILYLLQINLAISNFPDLFKSFHEHIDVVYSTLPILTSKWESLNQDVFKTNQILTPDVVFDNVGYTYRHAEETAKKVFEKFNLEVKAGTHCAVMGESGVGKSTIAHLLMRFDDVTNGKILIGGIDIRDYEVKHLRESLSYVPSQPILFHRTIRENIILYSPDASQEQIVSACECAQIHGFISSLEKGYETLVSERGVNLSSGQKQRIAIARALLKKEAKIFIFDEITSALDEGAAGSLVTSIRNRLFTKTVFFMTHNADLANRMDRKVLI